MSNGVSPVLPGIHVGATIAVGLGAIDNYVASMEYQGAPLLGLGVEAEPFTVTAYEYDGANSAKISLKNARDMFWRAVPELEGLQYAISLAPEAELAGTFALTDDGNGHIWVNVDSAPPDPYVGTGPDGYLAYGFARAAATEFDIEVWSGG